MSQREPKLLVLDMAEALDRALSYVEGMSYEDFLADQKTKDAVVRNIQVIGEAANRIPEATRMMAPEIEWVRIAKSRHVLVHDYFETDDEIIWRILEVHLPELQSQLADLIARI